MRRIIQDTTSILESHNIRYRIYGFDWRVPRIAAELVPHAVRVALVKPGTMDRAWLGREPIHDLPAMARAAGATKLAPDRSMVTPELIRQARANGMSVVAWTVNDPAEMARLIDMGVRGIVTDYPDRLERVISEHGNPPFSSEPGGHHPAPSTPDTPVRLSFDEFRRRFLEGPGAISCLLDQKRIEQLAHSGEVSVTQHALHPFAEASKLHPPWYHDSRGVWLEYGDAGAIPYSIEDAARNFDFLPEIDRDRIDNMGYYYRGLSQPVHIVVPTYDLGGGRRLILDGNHRVLGALRYPETAARLEFSEIRLAAPVDATLLPDLVHWS